jgi:hypothetical protein
MPQTLESTAMLMNISRWVNYRATLYWLAMMGTIFACIIIFIVHRAKNPMQQQQQFMVNPVMFNGTPLYHVFRAAWFVSGMMVFFWICTEQYQYWWFINYYRENTSGRLREFWVDFDKKHVTCIVFVGVYLCWPLCNLLLEMAFWIVLIIPWYGYRAVCAPNLEQSRMPPGTELQNIPCCIRLDMFFTECHQGTRVGFSTKLWYMITGSPDPWLDFCGPQRGPMMNSTMDGGNLAPPMPRPGMGQEMRPMNQGPQGGMGMNQSMSGGFEPQPQQRAAPMGGQFGAAPPPQQQVTPSKPMQPSVSASFSMSQPSPQRTESGLWNSPSRGGEPSVNQSWAAEYDDSKRKKKKKHKDRGDDDSEAEKPKKKDKERRHSKHDS